MAKYKLVSDRDNTFFVSNVTKIAASVPTTGNYKVGDVVIASPINNNVYGWICVTAGSPGTWEVLTGGGDMSIFIGNLNELKTTNKNTIVDAINELFGNMSGFVNGLTITFKSPFENDDSLSESFSKIIELYEELKDKLINKGVALEGNESFQELIDLIGSVTITPPEGGGSGS